MAAFALYLEVSMVARRHFCPCKSFSQETFLAREHTLIWQRALEQGTASRLMIESLVAEQRQALRQVLMLDAGRN